ncbi:MAG: RNA recognition motif domain-containing protein [Kiritimatiellia bacterium]
MGTRLYVGNLSFDTMESDIEALFSQAGKVVSCDLVTDRYTGKSRGFAFVEMATQAEADKAIAAFNGKELDGRRLTVNEARPRTNFRDSSGGGRKGGSGPRSRS